MTWLSSLFITPHNLWGQIDAGGGDNQAGPPNLPQRDPHLSTIPHLKKPTNPQLTSAGCRPRSSRLILLSIVPCVGRRKKGPNWKKWWASEFGRGTLGSELQGQGGWQPTGRWWRGSASPSSSSWQEPWWQSASPGVGRAAKFELLRRRNTPLSLTFLTSTFEQANLARCQQCARKADDKVDEQLHLSWY